MSSENTAKAFEAETEQERESTLKRLKSWVRSNLRSKNQDTLKEALEEVLEEHQEEGEKLPSEEQNMLKNILSFGELTVRDIMTPRTDIKAVEINISLSDLKEHIRQNSHTRVPVYNDTLDNIKGFIHIKDLMPLLYGGDTPFNMALILRDMLFVPPSMKLIGLLVKMRSAGIHMAIVIDEYGGTDGLVTLEDLFEEIVGEIQDEHDDEEDSKLNWNLYGTCDVDARVRIDRLEPELGLKLAQVGDETSFDTLGGLIFHKLGRVPTRGERVEHESGARFEILAADPRRVQRVRIYAPIPEAAETK